MPQSNSILTKLPGSSRGYLANFSERSLHSFSKFIIKEQVNKIYGFTILISITLQFILFKILYPFPDFILESFNYIETASQHLAVNVWPVGYSKFLILIHSITHSDTFLIGVQYFLLQGSLAYFFYSILYLFRPTRAIKNALFIFFFVNPILLYLSNCILPDTLFVSLSIIFLSQFFWMFHRPSFVQVIIQGVIISVAFTISYTAIYYLFISIIGLSLSKQKLTTKLWGLLIAITLITSFVLYTIQKTKEATGVAQFSVFKGWQLANNAMYMYPYIQVDSMTLPKQTLALNRLTKTFFSAISPSQRNLFSFAGSFFLVAPYAPLKQYSAQQSKDEEDGKLLQEWGKVSSIYNAYGRALIIQHPFSFTKYFLWPNAKTYYQPPLEKFDSYNLMANTIPYSAQDWFDYISADVTAISLTFQGSLFSIYPSIFLMLNILFWGHLSWLLVTGAFKQMEPIFRKSLYLIICFLVLHAMFSICTEPIVLRRQIIPMILLLSFSLLLGKSKQKSI